MLNVSRCTVTTILAMCADLLATSDAQKLWGRAMHSASGFAECHGGFRSYLPTVVKASDRSWRHRGLLSRLVGLGGGETAA